MKKLKLFSGLELRIFGDLGKYWYEVYSEGDEAVISDCLRTFPLEYEAIQDGLNFCMDFLPEDL